MRRRDFIWEEAPPGYGDPQDRPGDEEPLTATAALDEETYTERPAHEYYDEAHQEDANRSWDAAHHEHHRRENLRYNPPYTDWQDLGQMQDHAGRTYNVRYRQHGPYGNHMVQAVDPNVDHRLDDNGDDHEAVIKWDPHSGEIMWRGASRTHSGGFLSMALKHHAHEHLPADIIRPHHSTNLTGPGRSSLRAYLDRHGDPYGDIERALGGHRDEYGEDDDDDYDRDDYDEEDDEPIGPTPEQSRRLYNHGFREDNTGHYGKDFYDHNGDIIESHDIDPDGNLRVYTRGLDGNMIHNNHASLNYAYDFDQAMEHSRHGFAERHLPGEGWEPHYLAPAMDYRNFQSNQDEPDRQTRHERPYKWTKTTEVNGDRPYESTIYLPRGENPAYRLETTRQGMNDTLVNDDDDVLGSMLPEERKWTQGRHPGGRRDFRLTHAELRDAMREHFGREPSTTSGEQGTTYSDSASPVEGKADRGFMTPDYDGGPAAIQTPNGSHTHMYYNWDTGRYEGDNIYGNHVIPGRQMTLPLERHMPITSSVKSDRGIGRASDSIFMGFWSL